MPNSASPANVSLSTRFHTWLSAVPLATRAVLLVCTAVFVLAATGAVPQIVQHGAAAPYRDLTQPWRLFTHMLIHEQLWHIVLNMMTFVPLAAASERAHGSIALVLLLLELSLLGELVHVAIAALLLAAGFPAAYYTTSIGMSGVIFSLLVISIHRTANASAANEQRSLCAIFTVPSSVYPWALLLVIQAFIPSVSFLGHLSGILVGYLFCLGLFDLIVTPQSIVSRLEGSVLSQRGGFVASSSSIASVPRSSPSSILHAFRNGLSETWASFRGGLQHLRNRLFGSSPHAHGPAYSNLPSNAPEPDVEAGASESGDKRFPGTGHRLGG
ncbi:hypothetical protein CAOG_003393 [Capsaspora owczarzaki ATCC 30864]|uniref:Peptidase S54 rhomboid domain-containing protein n=2 Tax=Capsaspora owczarzaki (strain ATCC 30864) TaxID=595528 RepID=A0A0D2UBK1_CAPO3|nr:hypothetical protein CAOG_003393 [Capsaspora owczarzaki ATCC 30864]